MLWRCDIGTTSPDIWWSKTWGSWRLTMDCTSGFPGFHRAQNCQNPSSARDSPMFISWVAKGKCCKWSAFLILPTHVFIHAGLAQRQVQSEGPAKGKKVKHMHWIYEMTNQKIKIHKISHTIFKETSNGLRSQPCIFLGGKIEEMTLDHECSWVFTWSCVDFLLFAAVFCWSDFVKESCETAMAVRRHTSKKPAVQADGSWASSWCRCWIWSCGDWRVQTW